MAFWAAFLAGVALVSYGTACIYRPAGVLLGGVLLLAATPRVRGAAKGLEPKLKRLLRALGRPEQITDLVGLLGASLLVYGVSRASVTAAFIQAGLLLTAAALLAARASTEAKDG